MQQSHILKSRVAPNYWNLLSNLLQRIQKFDWQNTGLNNLLQAPSNNNNSLKYSMSIIAEYHHRISLMFREVKTEGATWLCEWKSELKIKNTALKRSKDKVTNWAALRHLLFGSDVWSVNKILKCEMKSQCLKWNPEVKTFNW